MCEERNERDKSGGGGGKEKTGTRASAGRAEGTTVRREDNAVRFSARSTWISLKMRLSILGGSSVSILISFLVRAGLSRKSSRATSQPRWYPAGPSFPLAAHTLLP